MIEIFAALLFVAGAVEWLFGTLTKCSTDGLRALAIGFGLMMAVGMTIGGIYNWSHPEFRDGFTLMFFLWAAFGVVIAVKAAKK
jgi:hypothetical protein